MLEARQRKKYLSSITFLVKMSKSYVVNFSREVTP